MADILYLCDRKACEKCSYPTCAHTSHIEHAVNFVAAHDGPFVEVDLQAIQCVVRCRCCEYADDVSYEDGLLCKLKMVGVVRPDDFCSFGRRKGGVANE